MAKQFDRIDEAHRAFIARQRIFFTASAAAGTRVNLSPRGTDALRLLGPNAMAYLDRTGSGNETAAHLLADGRLTVMFCAFEGAPRILRLYGRGRTLPRGSPPYRTLLSEAFIRNPVDCFAMRISASLKCRAGLLIRYPL